MNGKKGIRTAILAYLIVGCVGLGFGVFAHAQGLDDNLLSTLVSSKDQTETKTDEIEVSEEETSVDESTESGDELEALLEEAHAEEETSTKDKLTEDELASQDTSSEEDLSDEEEALKEEETEEESAAVLREGPYYQYTIVSDFDLNMYNAQDTPTGSGVIGVIPKGTTGYAIEQGSRRTLIEYEGNYAYVSNTYTQLSEVSADEYPNELKNITMENVVISE